MIDNGLQNTFIDDAHFDNGVSLDPLAARLLFDPAKFVADRLIRNHKIRQSVWKCIADRVNYIDNDESGVMQAGDRVRIAERGRCGAG